MTSTSAEEKEIFNYVMVLDESGSMSSLGPEPEHCINAFVKQIKDSDLDKVKTVYFSLYRFGTNHPDSIVCTYNKVLIADVPDKHNFAPYGATPLYDALGMALNDNKEIYNGVFHIITDGNENSSKKFKKKEINDMIENMEKNFNWTFQYTGAGKDSYDTAMDLGINKKYVVDYTKVGYSTGMSSQGSMSIGLGFRPGKTSQANHPSNTNTGVLSQASNPSNAGVISQSSKYAIAIGSNAGVMSQSNNIAIAMGSNTGVMSQSSNNAIDVGYNPEATKQSTSGLNLEAATLGLNLDATKQATLGLNLEAAILGLNPEATKQATLGLNLEAATLGLNPEATKQVTLGLNLEAATLGLNPEATKQVTLGLNLEATKQATLGLNPEATKQSTLGLNIEATKQATLGLNPEATKQPSLGWTIV
jgi:hypothetical protein